MKTVALVIFAVTGFLTILSFIVNNTFLLLLVIIGGVTLGGFFWEISRPFKNIPLGTPPQRFKRWINKNFDF